MSKERTLVKDLPEKAPFMVSAIFFLRSEYLDPDEATEQLGIIPFSKHKKGDRHGDNDEMVWKTGFWAIDTKSLVATQNIEDHIGWILERLERVKDRLVGIRSSGDVYMELEIIISLFRRNWNGVISPRTLERLTLLSIPVSFAVSYLAYPEEDEVYN